MKVWNNLLTLSIIGLFRVSLKIAKGAQKNANRNKIRLAFFVYTFDEIKNQIGEAKLRWNPLGTVCRKIPPNDQAFLSRVLLKQRV